LVANITSKAGLKKRCAKAERSTASFFENAGEGIFQSTPEGQYIEAILPRAHAWI